MSNGICSINAAKSKPQRGDKRGSGHRPSPRVTGNLELSLPVGPDKCACVEQSDQLPVCRQTGNNLIGSIASKFKTVDDFVSVKASEFNKSQQRSRSGSQQVQYQSVTNHKIQ